MALSVPLPGNQYKAVSLYSSDYPEAASASASVENVRAIKLVTACGHTLPKPIRGDVFIGRAHDNDELEWERVDFRTSDANPTARWCRVARTPGGGGGQGGSAASSLNGLVEQQLNSLSNSKNMMMMMNDNNNNNGPAQVIAPPPTESSSSARMFGMDGSPAVQESWGSWTQTAEEVEVKLTLPAGTKSKDCKIIFKRTKLSISIFNEMKVNGTLFADIVPDECTYTIEDNKNSKTSSSDHDGTTRELCVTLTKAKEDATWSFLTES
eukprot:scaffold23626_cov142-Cylindrotheca_fusiformis.AAC.2